MAQDFSKYITPTYVAGAASVPLLLWLISKKNKSRAVKNR